MIADENVQSARLRLMSRQLAAIRARAPALHDGSEDRLRTRYQRGATPLHETLEAAGVSREDLSACWQLYERDRRLRFLYNLPQSAVFGHDFGQAFETAVYGDTTDASGQVAALLNVFTTITDGLLDEAPELIADERELLLGVVSKELEPSDVGPLEEKHPLVRIAYLLVFEWMRRVDERAEALQELTPRCTFIEALQAALRAEYASTTLHLGGSIPTRADARTLTQKSTEPVWVIALVPICVRGWPDHLDPTAYRDLARSVGEYFGWIDDVCDVREDLRAGQWSNVLLQIAADHPESLAPRDADEQRNELARGVAEDETQRRLVDIGEQLYARTLEDAETLGTNTHPLLTLVADVTTSWLHSE